MHVEDSIGEGYERFQVVHLKPDTVGGIEVESEIWGGNLFKHPFPNRGAIGEVLSGGPLVFGEKHRTILNPDADTVVGSELD